MRGVSSTRGGGRGRPAVATTAASRVDPSRRPAITAATMVYESDFYTTRRTYGRPSYSTYSVTYEPAHLCPGYGKGQTYHHIIPHAGHMRLTAVSAPSFSTRSRPSVILAEMDRINHRMRPHLAYQPAEDFLNSRSIVSFDDEARSIRGQAAQLLKRIHTPVPRALRPLPVITTGYEYEELPLPPRITSDMYIQRLLGIRDVQHEVLSRSYYNEPGSRANIGKGHLACIQYAGGKAFSRRRPLASHENNGDYIRNNVKMLSHYERMREAAKSPLVEDKASRSTFRVPRPVNSGFYRPTNDPGKEYAEALASAAVATANFNMHTAALEENRKNKQKREDARLASAAEEREKEGESATDAEPQSEQVQKKLEEEVKRKAEEEAKRKAEEEAKKQAEEKAKKKAEEEAKKKAEEEAKKKAEEEAKKKAEEEAKKKAEEEEEAKRKAEEEAKRKAEEEAKKKAEEEAKRKAEEEEAKRKAEEEEAKRKAEEEEEAKRKAEEEEARKKAEEEAKKKEEEEARIKAEEEEARRKQEEEEEAKKKSEEEAAAAAQESEPAKEGDVEDIWADVDEDMPRKKVVPEVAADTAEEESQPAADQTDSKPAEEEQTDQGPEPVVEEPTSPETPAPTEQPEIEEVPASEEE